MDYGILNRKYRNLEFLFDSKFIDVYRLELDDETIDIPVRKMRLLWKDKNGGVYETESIESHKNNR